MPFRSKAQWRKFFADPKLRQYAKQWAHHTKQRYKKLPRRKGRRK
jgi:hypothetical protein